MTESMHRRTFLKTVGASAALAANPLRSMAQEKPSDVIVIGAGLAGLNAALLLEEMGARVTCLEGRNRAGGRLLSHQDVTGNPEWGGDSILGGYGRMQDTAKRLKVELVDHQARRDLSPEAHRDPKTVELAIGGEVIPRDQWATHPLNVMPEDARSRFPGRGYFQSVIGQHNPLASYSDWTAPESAKFDRSAHAFFKELGWSDAAIELNYNTNVQYGTSAHDVSMLMWFFVQAWFKLQSDVARVAYKAEGGNQRLPEAMANALNNEVHFGKQVVGIRSDRHESCRPLSRRQRLSCTPGDLFASHPHYALGEVRSATTSGQGKGHSYSPSTEDHQGYFGPEAALLGGRWVEPGDVDGYRGWRSSSLTGRGRCQRRDLPDGLGTGALGRSLGHPRRRRRDGAGPLCL